MADINRPAYQLDAVLIGKETTFHIKKISTGDVITRTATEAAKDADMIGGMSPADACLVGMWFGKDQSKETIEYFRQEANKKSGSAHV